MRSSRYSTNSADQHGLEKIKTIGDAYMAVGGLPTPLENHAEAVAEAALAMHGKRWPGLPLRSAEQFKMRIGMNTGPVVAGIIGARKFAYDLWGDTVNTASRMETNSPVGGILVTAATYERLQHKYRFKRAKILKVKGKGRRGDVSVAGTSLDRAVEKRDAHFNCQDRVWESETSDATLEILTKRAKPDRFTFGP